MAQYSDRFPINATGRFYVDSSCIDCDQCRHHAPDFFLREDREAHSFVVRQPITPEEIALCVEAANGCPVESIGADGDAGSGAEINYYTNTHAGASHV